MPIINIFSAIREDTTFVSTMMENVRSAGSKALGTPKNNIWVAFQPLLHELNESKIPYVIVKANMGRSLAEKSAFMNSIAEEVGRSLAVPAHQIWIQYEELNPENIWFNGHWVGNRSSSKTHPATQT